MQFKAKFLAVWLLHADVQDGSSEYRGWFEVNATGSNTGTLSLEATMVRTYFRIARILSGV